MVRAEKNSALIGQFVYDANGKQVKTIVNGVTTSYVGNHYEVKDGAVTKYYFAGTTRLAVRHGTTLNYLLSDHLGSSSVTTDENGIQTAQAMYKTFGETRYFIGDLKTDYTFTGQREEASLGLYFFVARWFDPSLGRFTSPDTIVPTSTQGTQAWDRYAFVNNNPVKYKDTTGHDINCGIGDYSCQQQVELEKQFAAYAAPQESPWSTFKVVVGGLSESEVEVLENTPDLTDVEAGFNVNSATSKAKTATENMFAGQSMLNSPADAFRHAYWSALLTLSSGADFARDFTTAHETQPNSDPDARQQSFMDMHNNNIGITIALANPNATPDQLMDLIYQALISGNLVVWDGQHVYYSDECPDCDYTDEK